MPIIINSSHVLYPDNSSTAAGFLGAARVDFNQNGYQKLPSGLIIQWGLVAIPSGVWSSFNVNFHLVFPQGCLFATANVTALDSYPYNNCVTSVTNTLFNFRRDSGDTYATSIRWFAIGY
jgi:hypothetical protein